MTDEEYDELDELLTRTVPKLVPNGTAFFSSKGFQMIAVDEPPVISMPSRWLPARPSRNW